MVTLSFTSPTVKLKSIRATWATVELHSAARRCPEARLLHRNFILAGMQARQGVISLAIRDCRRVDVRRYIAGAHRGSRNSSAIRICNQSCNLGRLCPCAAAKQHADAKEQADFVQYRQNAFTFLRY